MKPYFLFFLHTGFSLACGRVTVADCPGCTTACLPAVKHVHTNQPHERRFENKKQIFTVRCARRHNTARHGRQGAAQRLRWLRFVCLFWFVPAVTCGEERRSPPAFNSACEPSHRLIDVFPSALWYIFDTANVFSPSWL